MEFHHSQPRGWVHYQQCMHGVWRLWADAWCNAGPENFVLDASTIMKVKLQAPYLMLRCSTEVQYISLHHACYLFDLDAFLCRGHPAYTVCGSTPTLREMRSLLRSKSKAICCAIPLEVTVLISCRCLTSLKQVKSTTAVKTSEATVAQPAAKHDIKPDKKPSPQKTLPEKVSVPVTVAPIVETKPGMMVNKVDDVETIKCSSAIPFSDVSMRLLSPSDVTGVIRRFPKRSL